VQGNNGIPAATAGPPAATAACVDAETLAAWADGGLPTGEAAAVETHLADCERCTAMVATFARTIPDAPQAESLWTRWHLRWLVPLATAATAAALWVLVPQPNEPQMTTLGRAPSTEAQPQAPGSADGAVPVTPAETKEQEAAGSRRPSTPTDAFAKRDEPLRAPGQLADERRDANDSAKRLQSAPSNERITAAPQAREETDRADRTEAKVADAQTEPFSPTPRSANAAPAAPAESASSAVPAPAAAAPPAAPAPPATLGAASGARARSATSDRGAATLFEIVSPDPATRWRVVGAGQVERSTNGGARWETATLPESATLTGGSSPSPSVCWLVGRAGAIYVTTDGLRFVRVLPPDRLDFVSIQAIDGRRATVVTIDGRTMRTEDQGATWIRIAP
jgi:hypothetical protein